MLISFSGLNYSTPSKLALVCLPESEFGLSKMQMLRKDINASGSHFITAFWGFFLVALIKTEH